MTSAKLAEQWLAACSRHDLTYRRCPTCGSSTFVPRLHCTTCAAEMVWSRSEGAGIVFAETLVHRSAVTAAGSRAPYALAYVEIDEGPRVLTMLTERAKIGTRVGVKFWQTEDMVVPVFEPQPEPAADQPHSRAAGENS